MTDGRNVVLLHGPGETGPGNPDWPVPPVYEPLYTFHALGAMAIYLASPAGRWMEFGKVLEIVNTYEKALATAQFELWGCQGMKS